MQLRFLIFRIFSSLNGNGRQASPPGGFGSCLRHSSVRLFLQFYFSKASQSISQFTIFEEEDILTGNNFVLILEGFSLF